MVGDGNAAGQAAVVLAATARQSTSWSAEGTGRDDVSYLVRRIEEHPAIIFRTQTRSWSWKDTEISSASNGATFELGEIERHDISHVFLMTGAIPNTGWLDGCVVMDQKGFVKTRIGSVAGTSITPSGRSRGRRICSKPVAAVVLRLVTCGAATSSASPPPSVKDRLRSRLSTNCCTNRYA